MSTLEIAFVGAFALVGIGLYGLLITRNLIKVVVALRSGQVLVALVAAGESRGQIDLGQSVALTVIVADTVVAVIGLALAIQAKRLLGTLDLNALTQLKG